MQIKRKINRYIVDLIIIFESILLSLKYYYPIETLRYFHFGIIGLIFVIGILSVFKKDQKRLPRKQSLTFFFLLTTSFIYCFLIRGNITQWTIFIASVIFLYYLFNHGIDEKTFKLLILVNAIISIIHLINYERRAIYSLELIEDLTYGNSNMTGIIITSSILILLIGLFYIKKRIYKILLLALIIGDLYLLSETANRGSILSLIVLFILIVYYRKSGQINRHIKRVLILFPIIFVWLYTGVLLTFSEDSIVFGKVLFSGRSEEWSYLISEIINNPFSTSEIPSGGLNFSIAGVIEIGIISFSLFIFLLLIMEPHFIKVKKIDFKHVAYLAFLCIFIQQTFESTLIEGVFGLYTYSYILLGISVSSFKNQDSLSF
jgi:hypothetical protein